MKILLLSFALFFLASCGSSQKDKCQSANWYQRGYQIAKKGAYPDADFYVKKCRGVNADIDDGQLDLGFKKGREEICDPKVAHQNGKDGRIYDFPICMNYNEKKMQKAYASGLKSYCQPGKAYQVGAAGKEYENVCSDSTSFQKQYHLGRRKYLQSNIARLEKDLSTTEGRIQKAKAQQKEISTRLEKERLFPDVKMKLQQQMQQLSFDLANLKSDLDQQRSNLNKYRSALNKSSGASQ